MPKPDNETALNLIAQAESFATGLQLIALALDTLPKEQAGPSRSTPRKSWCAWAVLKAATGPLTVREITSAVLAGQGVTEPGRQVALCRRLQRARLPQVQGRQDR
jgi:hypothetical protein